jgi:hypothetical protein
LYSVATAFKYGPVAAGISLAVMAIVETFIPTNPVKARYELIDTICANGSSHEVVYIDEGRPYGGFYSCKHKRKISPS